MSKATILILILLLNTIVFSYSIKCDNPLDCFEKAIELVEKDRAEMKRIIEEFDKTKSELLKRIVDLEAIVASKTEAIDRQITNLTSAHDSNYVQITSHSTQLSNLTSAHDSNYAQIQNIAGQTQDLYNKNQEVRKIAIGSIPVNDFIVQIRAFNINKCLQHTGVGNPFILGDCNGAQIQKFKIIPTGNPNFPYSLVGFPV